MESPDFSIPKRPMSLLSLSMEIIIKQKVPIPPNSLPVELDEDIANLNMVEGNYNLCSLTICRFNTSTQKPLPVDRKQIEDDKTKVILMRTNSGWILLGWIYGPIFFDLGYQEVKERQGMQEWQEKSCCWLKASKVKRITSRDFSGFSFGMFHLMQFEFDAAAGSLEIEETITEPNEGDNAHDGVHVIRKCKYLKA